MEKPDSCRREGKRITFSIEFRALEEPGLAHFPIEAADHQHLTVSELRGGEVFARRNQVAGANKGSGERIV